MPSGRCTVQLPFLLYVLLMLFNIYCVNYLMKIDIIHVYYRVINKLKHDFLTKAHCK